MLDMVDHLSNGPAPGAAAPLPIMENPMAISSPQTEISQTESAPEQMAPEKPSKPAATSAAGGIGTEASTTGAGAAAGTAIYPGIGTVIGAAVGAIGGAIDNIISGKW